MRSKAVQYPDNNARAYNERVHATTTACMKAIKQMKKWKKTQVILVFRLQAEQVAATPAEPSTVQDNTQKYMHVPLCHFLK